MLQEVGKIWVSDIYCNFYSIDLLNKYLKDEFYDKV